jgi:putrescine transport system permease protein
MAQLAFQQPGGGESVVAPRGQITRPEWQSGKVGPLLSLLLRFGPPRWSHYIRENWAGQRLVIGVPYLWLLLFFLVPFLIVLKISFAEFSPLGRPPFEPILRFVDGSLQEMKLVFSSYSYLLHEPLYVSAWLYSIKVALVSTVLCLLVGYPMAYAIARSSPTTRNILLMLVILPFWTSFLLRVYAWIGLLKTDGVINNVLLALGVIDAPLAMMNTSFAVYIGIVYSYLPFMIMPLYSNLEKHDLTLLEAAQDLGSGPIRSFLRITLPLSLPGVVAGSLLVFIPAVGEYVIPSLLGRTDQLMIATLLSDEFFRNRDWPKAGAVAIAMLLLLLVPIMVFQYFQNKELQAHKR